MNIEQTITDFLRDAQYRVAELTNELIGSQQYDETNTLREELILFMELLYEGRWRIKDGFNHIIGQWTDREITDEIEYLRSKAGLNLIPYITFTGYYPNILNITQGQNSGTLPQGTPNQVMGFNASGNPTPITLDPYGGAGDNETMTQYFAGRL